MNENNTKQVQNYLEELEKLNNEMKYNDPFKWLLRYEDLEEINETIENLEAEVKRLEQPYQFIGSKREYEIFMNRVNKRIEYLTECIEILTNLHNDIVEGEEE